MEKKSIVKFSLKEIRKEKKLTQGELADLLFVTQGAITGWETGRREADYETLYKLSEVLNVSIERLLGVNEKNNLNESEQELLMFFRTLNEEGQEKLLEQAEFFVSSGKYIKNNKSEMVQAK